MKRIMLDEEQRTVHVKNVLTDVEYTFTNLSVVDSLIDAAMLENRMTSSIHNPIYRDKFKNMIILGSYTMAIGDLAVLIVEEIGE